MKEPHMYIISSLADVEIDPATLMKAKSVSDCIKIRYAAADKIFPDRLSAQLALAEIRSGFERDIMPEFNPGTYKIESDENHFLVFFDNGNIMLYRIIEFGIL